MTATVERAAAYESRWAPRRRAGLPAACLDGETVLYDVAADTLHHLDRIATTVWERLDGAATVTALSAQLAAEFGARPDVVARDVSGLVRWLHDCGLLAGSPPPGGPPSAGGPSAPALARSMARVPKIDVDGVPAPYRTALARALHHDFVVETNISAARAYLEDVLSELSDVGRAQSRYRLLDLGPEVDEQARYYLDFDGEPVAAADRLGRVLAMLLWHINQEVVRTSAPHLVLVHAAAAVRSGTAVLLPAPQESGKTTTVAGLVRTGFTYLTDEAAAIEPDTLRIRPFPKALSVDEGSWRVLADLRPWHASTVPGQWQVPPGSIPRHGLGSAVAPPTRPGLVVSPHYRAGSTTSLTPATRAETLVLLADSTFAFQANPGRNLEVLARVAAHSDCYRLRVGDLDSAVEHISSLLPAAA